MGALLGAGLGLAGGALGLGLGMASAPNGPGATPLMDKISGYQQQIAANAQADALGQQATYATTTADYNAALNNYQTQKAIGTQNAQLASSGVMLSGSPLGLLAETQGFGNLQSNLIRQQGQLQANLYSAQALQYLRQGGNAAFMGQAQAAQDVYNYQLQKAQMMNGAMGAAVNGIGAAATFASNMPSFRLPSLGTPFGANTQSIGPPIDTI